MRLNLITLNTAFAGGGYYILSAVSAHVELNIITGNSAGDTGGAFHILDSGIEIKDNLIDFSGGAGAIYVKGLLTAPRIHENDIVSNTVSFGALWIDGLATPYVYANLFSTNDAISVKIETGAEALNSIGLPWPRFDMPPCTEPLNAYAGTFLYDVFFADGSSTCP